MATSKELTGGTGDVNPQILTASVIQSAADTTTSLEIPVPIARFQTKKGRSIVMEILKVKYDFGDIVTPGGAVNIAALLSTAASPAGTIDPTVFSSTKLDGIFATAVGFAYFPRGPFTDDLSDGAGHGFLVATDSMFLQLSSANTAIANTCVAKIYYRFKEVALEEYIGIVAGQQ